MAPTHTSEALGSPAALRLALAAGRLSLWLIRVPLAALLAILEPVIRVTFAALALLLVLTALFWALVRPFATVPFFGMLGLAVTLVLLGALYSAALRRLAP